MMNALPCLAIFGGGIGMTELLAIGVVALLIFGKRLPEVGRSLGKGLVEFKKGLAGIEDDINQAGDADRKQVSSGQAPSDTIETHDEREPADEHRASH